MSKTTAMRRSFREELQNVYCVSKQIKTIERHRVTLLFCKKTNPIVVSELSKMREVHRTIIKGTSDNLNTGTGHFMDGSSQI